MAGVNKVILIGNLGGDPDVRTMPNGNSVVNFSIATSETWKDRNTGERRDSTEWHRVVIFGKLAEIAGQYLKRGSRVYIEGKLQTRKWQDQSGVDRYVTEIIATEMSMLGQSNFASDNFINNDNYQSKPIANHSEPTSNLVNDFDDDIPF